MLLQHVSYEMNITNPISLSVIFSRCPSYQTRHSNESSIISPPTHGEWYCKYGRRVKALGPVRQYRQASNISCTLVCNKIVDHSDVARASPVGEAPTTSSFSIYHLASMHWAKTSARRDKNFFLFGASYTSSFAALVLLAILTGMTIDSAVAPWWHNTSIQRLTHWPLMMPNGVLSYPALVQIMACHLYST